MEEILIKKPYNVQICDRINNKGWTVVQDPQRRMGPYAYKGNQWVSFDDKEMIRRKAKLVRQLGLGGGMIWALDLDDFNNYCGEGVHPLLTELQSVLAEPSSELDTQPETIIMQSTTSAPTQDIDYQIIEETSHDSVVATEDENPSTSSGFESLADTDYKIVCYFSM